VPIGDRVNFNVVDKLVNSSMYFRDRPSLPLPLFFFFRERPSLPLPLPPALLLFVTIDTVDIARGASARQRFFYY
jgi:hypothetical protein